MLSENLSEKSIYFLNLTILSDLALILNLVFLSLERSYPDPQ
jgi:hypothetical protein